VVGLLKAKRAPGVLAGVPEPILRCEKVHGDQERHDKPPDSFATKLGQAQLLLL